MTRDEREYFEWDEQQYVDYLESERRRFAWIMQRHGGLTVAQAEAAALQRYPYQDKDSKFRGLVFHREAWQWGMQKVHGDSYWLDHPELERPSAEYLALG